MSYKQAVLRDNPISYWPFDGSAALRNYASILNEYGTYQNYLDSEDSYGQEIGSLVIEDISNIANHGAYTLSHPNFDGILPLATVASYDSNYSGCEINSSSEIVITNKINSYNMFYNGTENLDFSIEFWISFDAPPAVDNNILNIKSPSGELIKIYANNDKINFSIYGKDKITNNFLNYTSYKQIPSWDSQLHILATYSKKSINIFVNSIPGISIKLPDNFVFLPALSSKSDIYYHIGPSPVGYKYVINHFAFYDYILSEDKIKTHMIWGTNDSQPQIYSKETNASFFDIEDNDSMLAYKKAFANPQEYKTGTLTNLVTDKTGITFQSYDPLIKNTPSLMGDVSIDLNGVSFTEDCSLKFNNFSQYFSLSNFSILGQLNNLYTEGLDEQTILYIDGINNGESFYLAQTYNNKLTLYYNSQSTEFPYTFVSSILLQFDIDMIYAGSNFGLSFNNSQVSLYLEGAGTIISTNLPAYTYKKSNLYIGNSYTTNSQPFKGKIKNIAISTNYMDPSTYTLYGQQDLFNINLTSNYNISQKGTWEYTVPSSSYANLSGATVSWDSGMSDDVASSPNKYALVEISKDKGVTWNKIDNGKSIIKFLNSDSFIYPDISIRTTLLIDDSTPNELPRIDNFLIKMYNKLSISSDNGKYTIYPKNFGNFQHNYAIRNNYFNILSRTNNFGIKLNEVDGSDSSIIISPSNLNINFKTIDFWFRCDEFTSEKSQMVLSTEDSDRQIFISSDDSKIYKNGFNQVYLNGQEIGDGASIIVGETYHIVGIYDPATSSKIYLGGAINDTQFTRGTYGFITLYPNALTQIEVEKRYKSYLSMLTEHVADESYSNSIGSISEYIGSSTDYNAGKSVLSYVSPQNNLV